MANPFAHIELSTDDVAKAKKFYQAIFDWKISDMPAMNYTMIEVGKNLAGGGIQKKQMPEAPTAWLPYVQVDDVKKTLEKAAKAGAQVMLPYMSIGDMGAIAIFSDPTGAALGLWEQTKKPAPKAATKKPAAKKPAAKKPAAKKAPARKAPAKKAPAKKR